MIFCIYRDRIWTKMLGIRYSSTDFALTGATVGGNQPFGGSLHSETNDKTGYREKIMRRASPRITEGNTVPAREWKQLFMG